MKFFRGTTEIYSWKSKVMLEKSIENITTSDSNFTSTFIDTHPLPDVKFNGHCLVNKIPVFEKV